MDELYCNMEELCCRIKDCSMDAENGAAYQIERHPCRTAPNQTKPTGRRII